MKLTQSYLQSCIFVGIWKKWQHIFAKYCVVPHISCWKLLITQHWNLNAQGTLSIMHIFNFGIIFTIYTFYTIGQLTSCDMTDLTVASWCIILKDRCLVWVVNQLLFVYFYVPSQILPLSVRPLHLGLIFGSGPYLGKYACNSNDTSHVKASWVVFHDPVTFNSLWPTF